MSRKCFKLGGFLTLLVITWMRLPGIKQRDRTGKRFRCISSEKSSTRLRITSNTFGLYWLTSNVKGIRMQKWKEIEPNKWVALDNTTVKSRVTVKKHLPGKRIIKSSDSEMAHLLCQADGVYAIVYGHVADNHFERLGQINVEGKKNGVWEILKW